MISSHITDTTHVLLLIQLSPYKITVIYSVTHKKHLYSVYVKRVSPCGHLDSLEPSFQVSAVTLTPTLSTGSLTGAHTTGRMEKVAWRVSSSHCFQGGGSRWAKDESAASRRRLKSEVSWEFASRMVALMKGGSGFLFSF